jgi:hypothetical protein
VGALRAPRYIARPRRAPTVGARPLNAGVRRVPFFTVQFNSAAYRLFTLASIGSFLFGLATSRLMRSAELTSPEPTVVLFAICRVLGGAIIPAFLVWRNYCTIRRRQRMIPASLISAAPWYYQVAIVSVWIQLLAILVLPMLAVVLAYPLDLTIGNISAATFWFSAPTIFVMEVACASHCDTRLTTGCSER